MAGVVRTPRSLVSLAAEFDFLTSNDVSTASGMSGLRVWALVAGARRRACQPLVGGGLQQAVRAHACDPDNTIVAGHQADAVTLRVTAEEGVRWCYGVIGWRLRSLLSNHGKRVYIPRATSAQCNTVLLFRNSITPGSIVAGRSCGSTTVATIMSQRSLKTTDIADLPGRLRAVSV